MSLDIIWFANVWSEVKQIIMSNFHRLKGRGSESQLQVGENLNKIILTL